MMKTIEIGLIKGRHQMPTEQYLFDETEINMDKFSTGYISDITSELETRFCDILGSFRPMVDGSKNQSLYHCNNKTHVKIYATGLTWVLLCAINVLNLQYDDSVHLTVMHYNNASHSYVAQMMF